MVRLSHQATLGLFYQPPSPSPPCSFPLSILLTFAWSSWAVVVLTASASARISVLSTTSLECRRRVELSNWSFGQFRRPVLEHTDCLWNRSSAQLKTDRLHRVRANLIFVPALFPFFSLPLCGNVSSRSCRSLYVRQSCGLPYCDVQPLQLVRTSNRGNYVNPFHSDLLRFRSGLCIASTTAVQLSPARLAIVEAWFNTRQRYVI